MLPVPSFRSIVVPEGRLKVAGGQLALVTELVALWPK